MEGVAQLRLPSFTWGTADPVAGAMVTVAFLGDQVTHVPAYRSELDPGSARVVVSRLAGIAIEAAFTGVAPRPWRLVRATPAYRRVWAGTPADAERAVTSATASLRVTLENPSAAAAPLKLPALHTEPRMVACVALASTSGALLLALLYLFALIYFRVSENSGLPPPFFKYSANFRGG